MSKIMSINHNNIGFGYKGWNTIRKTILSQRNQPYHKEYWDALNSLSEISSTSGTVESEQSTEVALSPNSPFGSREIDTGTDYSSSSEIVLQGTIPLFEYSALTDEEIQKQLVQDLEEVTEFYPSVETVRDDIHSRLEGDVDVSISVMVEKFSRNADNTANIVVRVVVEGTSHENPIDRLHRLEDERASYREDY